MTFLSMHTLICTDLTESQQLPVGEFACRVAVQVATDVHKLVAFDWLLANTKYPTNFLPTNTYQEMNKPGHHIQCVGSPELRYTSNEDN